MLRDFGICGGHEGIHRGGIAGGPAQDFCSERGPAMQPFAEQEDVFGGIIGITEVREKEPRRFALKDGGEGSVPDAEINVRRRSGGDDGGNSPHAPAPPTSRQRGPPRLFWRTDAGRGTAGGGGNPASS